MNTYEQVTNTIVSALESGELPPWQKEWSGDAGIPMNPITKHTYQGVNVWTLLIEAWANNYPTNEWGTYRQWQSSGAQVRKGEKSTHAVFFKPIKATDDSGEEYTWNLARSFALFNAGQVDGYESPSIATGGTLLEDVGEVLEMPNALNIAIEAGSPAYHRGKDVIYMPEAKSFTSLEAYFATMAHECGHATGHASRLDRQFGKRFGDEEYAMEELVAELCAAYLCIAHGMNYRIEQHASYLDHWIRVLKQDSKAIFTVAAAAQRAADFVRGACATQRLIAEQDAQMSEFGELLCG